MFYQRNESVNHFFLLLVAVNIASCFLPAIADDAQSELVDQEKQSIDNSELGVEIGALFIIGADFRVFYRELNSPWLYGFRYLNIEDDFINESAVGFPSDESDKEFTTRTGIYLSYLFNNLSSESFYLGAALYNTTVKIQCEAESDSKSSASIYFGGGYQGRWPSGFGYNIGVLVSPFANIELNTATCGSEMNGDFDLNASLSYVF